MDISKFIEAIDRQVAKLDQEDFNLNSWKSSTKILLERIFGRSNSKIEEIEKIDDDKSSWSLRDSKGIPGIEKCKKQGREILEVCRTEIELFGIDDKENHIHPYFIVDNLKEKLKNSQFLELKNILISDKSLDMKQQLLKDFLKDIEILDELLASIIVQEEVINSVNEKS